MSLNSVDNIILRSSELEFSLKDCQWHSIQKTLIDVSQAINSYEGRINCSCHSLGMLIGTLQVACMHLRNNYSKDIVNAVCQCFRVLRNLCLKQKSVQEVLGESSCLDDTKDIICLLTEKHEDEETALCLQVSIQFLGNLVVDNHKNQTIVWEKYYQILMKFIDTKHPKLSNYASMVVYNIMLGNPEVKLRNGVNDVILLLTCSLGGSEFASFTVDLLLGQEVFLESTYQSMTSVKDKLQLLDAVLNTLLAGKSRSEARSLPASVVLFVAGQFKARADLILCLREQPSNPEPAEVMRLLDVLATASDGAPYLSEMQTDASLLICAACLLRSITDLGKSEGSVFSSKQRLADLKSDLADVQTHPAFGFKVSLVRLVGNLCYRHEDNQNKVRELGCLPALLDACNIDVYNPLLLQWGVLAVRNLLEGNAENQRVLAGLVQQGPAPCAALQELGVTLEQSPDGRLCMAPLHRPH